MGNTAAFFDIDGTLYRDSLMVEHFKKLIKYDIIDQKDWYSNVRDTFMDWDKRQGNYDDYLLEVSELYVRSITGLDTTCINFTSDQVIKLKADRVYKYTRSRIAWHLKQGHIVIFISGSPNFLVEKMAKKYNASDFCGSEYIFKNDVFTGNLIPMWDSNSKNTSINNFTKKYEIDLLNSYAYGDTSGDFNMLRRVGKPIAINPTKELLKMINLNENMKNKTNIIVERKDLVYSLTSRVEIIDI
ncbi:MAG: HAD-IB family hydrolase [Clostridioides difficile]|nr:HAD-IB family hydrolase [Clostridioides difficile]